MALIKIGDKGSLVKLIQEKLGIYSDGIFGNGTLEAIKKFQSKNGLKADGIVGSETFAKLGIVNPSEELSTDMTNVNTSSSIDTAYLDKDEYFKANKEKEYLFLHHTAGSHNPYATIKNWNDDTRGQIATQFVIGNVSTNGDTTYDGKIVEAFPNGSWAYHLGNNGNKNLHPNSIGIEICSYGFLTKGYFMKGSNKVIGDSNKFYNYVGGVVPNDQVCDLGYEFNGHKFYHKYSDKQLSSLEVLIKKILSENPKIDVNKGLKEWIGIDTPQKAFGYKEDAFLGKIKGILSHTNVRKDKTDVYPDPRLIRLIKNL